MRLFLVAIKQQWRGLTAAALLCVSAWAHSSPVKLEVDAADAPRKILHARLSIPVMAGPLTLLYPKWIPGEHGPTGPITDLVGLKISAAGGQPISWKRDPDDMFAFHLEVPAGAQTLDVALDFLLPPNSGQFSSGASATARLVDINWNQVLLYPKGARPEELQYAVSLRLPQGWQFGTALPVAGQDAANVQFDPVSLESLVDSPLIAGADFRTIDLSPGGQPAHALHIAADSAAALEMKPEDIRRFEHLVSETGALFGARHYRSYHFLLTLSDHVAHFGLEHHESSDNRVEEKYLINDDLRMLGAFLLCHEMVHSWNGKFRRPAGLATPDFQQPMRGELLWVYEGLTDYLGILLTARSGLWTNENFREYLALEAATLDRQQGRSWRPLSDTTDAAQLLYMARSEGEGWRRGTDFYQEGDLIWLEADVIIRQQSQGRQSLDDFCKKFHGGQSGPPQVVPYTRDDVVNALNDIAPYDWRGFFQTRVYTTSAHAPLGGIEAAGWRLAYTNVLPSRLKAREGRDKYTDLSCSLGLTLKEDGYITDVIPGSPADKAGMGAAMKLIAVNSRRWTPEIVREAVKSAQKDPAPIQLLIENEEYFKTCEVDYHEGEKYPQLERDPTKPDLLSQILSPLTPAPQ
jgi:predicted metalloprotease with PDZ domain